MPLCKDPLVTHLKKLGMNVVYPPRSTLVPLELMLKQNKQLSRWGDAKDVFISNQPLPEVKNNTTVSSIQGATTVSHDLSIGLSILTTILSQVGAKVGLKATYKNAKKLQFTYENISSQSCDLVQIDKFLNSGNLDDAAVSTAEYLKSDSLYVVSEIFQSNKISVEAKDQSGATIEVEIPEIQQVGSANIGIERASTTDHAIVYKGDTSITFAMRAYNIDYVSNGDDAKYMLKRAKNGTNTRSIGRDVESEKYEDLDNQIEFDFK